MKVREVVYRAGSRTPHLCLFASSPVPPHTELCVSYAGGRGGEEEEGGGERRGVQGQGLEVAGGREGRRRVKRRKVCRCGSSVCCGFLPFDRTAA